MRYVNINEECVLPDISDYAPFKAVMTIEQPVSAQRQAEISRWLIDMGCRYLMSCGEGCESWCDSVREENLKNLDVDTMRARDIVMTTSHFREPLRSVFWYAKTVARHPEFTLEHFLVIHLAERDRSTEYQAIYQKS